MMITTMTLQSLAPVLFVYLVCIVPVVSRLTVSHPRHASSAPDDPSIEWISLGSSNNNNSAYIVINVTSGAATIFLADEAWFELQEGMAVAGWDEMTLLSSAVNKNGQHAQFGPYTNVSFTWTNANTAQQQQTIQTTYSIFEKQELILFDQYFETGWTRPPDSSSALPTIVGPFPSIDLKQRPSNLSYLSWGSCFLGDTRAGEWDQVDNYHELFTGDTYGQPWVLHNYRGRSAVWSSAANYFVSGFAVEPDSDNEGDKTTNTILHAGLRTTLTSIPVNFRHTSVMVAGTGINATLMEWGDVLLHLGGTGKHRAKVYDDFMLAHLGYWTDNGAYHYRGAHNGYANMEEALLDIKKGFNESNIPIRYLQWDDWWMKSKGDIPGMLSWEPKPEVFPSGFSNWLGLPLAMYAPEYSGENVWIHDYHWKVVNVSRGPTAIPLDPNFYIDLFHNGTKIGMVMFEQDFLCSYGIGDSGLTSTDVHSGSQWLKNMDDAAIIYGIKLQFCMPDAYHLLHSTKIVSVTNARATGDNTREWRSILSMGQNGLLFYALGVYASRDNVWTSNAKVEQVGCGNFNQSGFCFETNAPLDNAVAVLSNGPYGIADGLGYTNKTLVMYSCRSDGRMLRPRWPLASLDFSFTMPDAKGSFVWAAHDDFGPYRWSYIIGVELSHNVPITPSRLVQGAIDGYPSTMVAWEVAVGQPVSVTVFSESLPFQLPKSRPLDLPYDVPASSHTHFATAPILPNGMVILGEYQKWATMSFGRITHLAATEYTVTLEIVGAPSETIELAYISNVPMMHGADFGLVDPLVVNTLKCTLPSSCTEVDKHSNPYCRIWVVCQPRFGCDCSSNAAVENGRLPSALNEFQ